MSTRKNIDRVCIIITVIAVLVAALFMNGSALGIQMDTVVAMDYADSLFDDSYVHSIDIEIADWDSFLETATSEEYTAVNVTIDGEKIKNVGLRAKGNTSLSTVQQLGSERYSLKLEFDKYQETNTYHGLDKLCLNNLIQDYTMMKDYIAYKLMNEFGVASPLVSYVYVTVNGEDWGLFLAVEAVEDSFLERNYGSDYGDLYKPDSMSMGGGRGNGDGFDMREVDFDEMGIENPFENGDWKKPEDAADGESSGDGFDPGNMDFSQMSPPDFAAGDSSGGDFPGGDFPGGGGFGMGSSDAKLKYTDDDVDSYSTIFVNAKTISSYSDQKRLIRALKSLNEGLANGDAQEIAEAVDVDAVLRYMVVHNFVVNGDSYTGSMIHNYYLYEDDGQLSMIPWDYNLAYGTFQANDASSAVNDPIDNPLSITDGDTDRPMFSWIISCDEYTQMYHQYYEEFISQIYDSGYLTNLIDTTYEMIYNYVVKDPTKFCETSEFEKAVSTIKEFVSLRSESIKGQLDGTIGSTDAAQEADSSTLINASSITLSDMGSMGGGGGPGGGGPGGDRDDKSQGGPPTFGGTDDSNKASSSGSGHGSGHHRPGSKDSSSDKADSSDSQKTESIDTTASQFSGMPGGFGGGMPDGFGGPTSSFNTTNLLCMGGWILLLVAGIVVAATYKRRRH